jgi:hypothetical protein
MARQGRQAGQAADSCTLQNGTKDSAACDAAEWTALLKQAEAIASGIRVKQQPLVGVVHLNLACMNTVCSIHNESPASGHAYCIMQWGAE